MIPEHHPASQSQRQSKNILPILETSQMIKSSKKFVQLSPFQTSFASKFKDKTNPCCCRLPKFSMDVFWNKSTIQLQSADIAWSNSSISSTTRKSLRYRSCLPLPDHQPIKGIYHGVSPGQTTVLFVASYRTQNKTKHQNQRTHTRSKTKTDEAPSGSTQKQRPTVSANPHPPQEDRHIMETETVISLSEFQDSFTLPFAKLSHSNSSVVSTFVEQRLRSRH